MPDNPFQRFIRELKQRKVLRVAGVYALVAWGVIQVAETIFPILLLPEWLLTAVTVLALLGFPFAVVVAWALELTPDGVRRAESGPASGTGNGPGVGAWLGFGLVIVLTAVGGYLYLGSGEPEVLPDRSVAVLPFDNLSGEAENEYFSDGITEDVLTNLSKIGALRVISRTSVMTYKGTEKTVPEIAGELGVAYVLEGSVRRAGDEVRITAQLIHAPTDAHVWAETYDRQLTDIFAIQSEIARAIAAQLRAELTPEVQDRLAVTPTDNLRAYEAYLKGRGLVDQRTAEPLRQAIEHFQRAIERDPDYGLAWAGLADALGLLRFYDYAIPDSVPDALAAALRAVELNPDLGQTHASLGIAYSLQHDGPSALRELNRAIELTPSYGEPYAWLGWVRLLMGRPEQAIEPSEAAVELDPLAPAYRVYLAEGYLVTGRTDAALREARRAMDLQPEYGLAHYMAGLVLYHMGRYAEAESAMLRARALVPPRGTPSHSEIDAVLAMSRIATGDDTGARSLLADLAGRQEDPDAVFSTGLVRAALGNLDAAFEVFRGVDHWGSFANDHLRYFFPEALAQLRSDPRYDGIIRAVDRSWGVGGQGRPTHSD